MTRNIDGLSLSGEKEIPPVSWTLRSLENKYATDWEDWLSLRLDVSRKGGYKPKDGRGDDRMRRFVRWLFTSCDAEVVIISGHSLWFRRFFQEYLARESKCEGKKSKIMNGGVVAVDFTKYELGSGLTRMVASEVTVVCGGFDLKKKR